MKASTVDASHTICDAIQKQGSQEAVTLLLGGMPEIRRQWEVETGDDSSRVRAVPSHIISTKSRPQ